MKNAKFTRKKVSELIKVWDIPTRLFHWSIVCLVISSWYTADKGYMKAHLWSGTTLLSLLLFRLVWGFLGSTTARFSNFLRGPSEVFTYLKSLWRYQKPLYAGHNPAGGLMVMALLLILFVQVVTGLFSNDGVRFHGPLALRISPILSDQITQIHGWLFYGIMFLVWMHLVAIFFYLCVKGENLIRPMLNGHKRRMNLPKKVHLEFANSLLALAIFITLFSIISYTFLRIL